jgi:hypothetical protein
MGGGKGRRRAALVGVQLTHQAAIGLQQRTRQQSRRGNVGSCSGLKGLECNPRERGCCRGYMLQ